MLNQGSAERRHRKNGHCYANQVVMKIYTNYSWQSCRIKVRQKGDTGETGIVMQIGWTYTDNQLSGLYGIAQGNGRKKESARKRTRDRRRI
jgi:hypothetical protein